MFNLSKMAQNPPTGALEDMYSRGDLGGIDEQLIEEGQELIDVNEGDAAQQQREFDPTELNDEQVAEQADKLIDAATLRAANEYLMSQGQEGRTAWWALVDEIAAQDVANDSWYRDVAAQLDSDPQLKAIEPQALQEAERRVMSGPLGSTIQKILTQLRGQQEGSEFLQPVASKKAQVQALETDVADKGTFISSYVEDLLAYNGDKGPEDARSENAKNAILAMVSPAAHEEVNSPLEKIQGLSPQIDRQRAEQILSYIFENWIAPAGVETQMQTQPGMEPVMSEKNPKGIVKFNLSDQVLNNSHTVVKTAADQFGQQYLLYGPTEKRVCPKLRGKGGGVPGSGDVVSEYICRHHCLDGIVIDDNKTVCGEALWRAHAMDKQSREYVDEDGNIKGGYIEKRFEVNHNVPEENKMRLKPGETRKVRPPEWGNTESRMQAMRKANGEERGYRPDTNTGDPFKWCTDVDQNNVEQPQAERDRREEAMGHKTVQYTNKSDQENKPKVAFNLKQAQQETPKERIKRRLQGKPAPDPKAEETPEEAVKRRLRGQIGETDKQRIDRRMKGAEAKEARCWEGYEPTKKNKKKGFNLRHLKEAVEMVEITEPYEELKSMVQEEQAEIPINPEKEQIDKLKEIRDKAVTTPAKSKVPVKSKAAFNLQRLAQGANIPFQNDGHSLSEDGHIEPMKSSKKKNMRRPGYGPSSLNPETDQNSPEFSRYEFEEEELEEGEKRNEDIERAISKPKRPKRKHAEKEKGVTYKGEHFKYNPWAVCNKSTGGKNEAGEEKFERCVQHVKDQDRERKDEPKKKS